MQVGRLGELGAKLHKAPTTRPESGPQTTSTREPYGLARAGVEQSGARQANRLRQSLRCREDFLVAC